MLIRLLAILFICGTCSCQTPRSKTKQLNLSFCREDLLSPSSQKAVEARAKLIQRRNQLHAALIAENILYLQELYQSSSTYRAQLQQFTQQLKANKDEPLSAAQLNRMSSGIHDFAYLSREYLDLINRHRLALYDFEENPQISPERIKALCFCLSAMIQLYDMSHDSVMLMNSRPNLRLAIRQGIRDTGVPKNFYEQSIELYYSTSARSLTRKILEELKNNEQILIQLRSKDHHLDSLLSMIEGSSFAANLNSNSSLSDFAEKILAKKQHYLDNVSKVGNQSMHISSKAFGNAVGLFSTRKGKLYKKSNIQKDIAAQLQPLDILLEKTPFRLTDKFIPGHFGHVAIYTGTEEELKAAHLWEHPLIVPHREKIRQGGCIVEALRHGVVLSRLDHFMNIDDFVAVRRDTPSHEKKCQYLINCFRQLGKEYDFNFNVEENERIVCSELAYQVFTDDKWPTERTLGRHTISPDQVIEKVFTDQFYTETVLYHDGRKVARENTRPLLRELLKIKDL